MDYHLAVTLAILAAALAAMLSDRLRPDVVALSVAVGLGVREAVLLFAAVLLPPLFWPLAGGGG